MDSRPATAEQWWFAGIRYSSRHRTGRGADAPPSIEAVSRTARSSGAARGSPSGSTTTSTRIASMRSTMVRLRRSVPTTGACTRRTTAEPRGAHWRPRAGSSSSVKWLTRGAERVINDLALLCLADIDHPGDPELVDQLAELVAPHLLFQRHGHGPAHGELVPVPAQLVGVLAAQADRDVVAGLTIDAGWRVRRHEREAAVGFELCVHDLVGDGRFGSAVLTECVQPEIAAEHALVELHRLLRVAVEHHVRVQTRTHVHLPGRGPDLRCYGVRGFEVRQVVPPPRSEGRLSAPVCCLFESARSSTDRACGYGPQGWGFDSLRARLRFEAHPADS